jgi:amino acid transporter
MPSPPRSLPSLQRALADPPLLEGVRDRSDLAGLARRAVRPIDLVGHSVAVVAPSASAIVSPFIMLRVVGPGAWLSAALGFGLAFVLTAVFSQFATRIAAPGSMYTWVTRAVGPLLGLLVASCMLLGYGTLVAFGVSQSVRHGIDATASAGLGTPAPVIQLGAAAVVIGICVLVSIRGVALSTRIALSTEAVLAASLVLLCLVTIVRVGPALSGILSLDGASPWRILLGASFIMSITVGFESSAALAGEAERTFLSVPRSLAATVAISAALYALSFVATHAVLVSSDEHLRGPAQRWFPSSFDARHADALLSSFISVGYVALALCALNALARVVFSLAREGLLPQVLGKTHPRWHSPSTALSRIAPLALIPAAIAILTGNEIGSITGKLLGAAVLVLAVAYALVCLAVPFLLVRLGEWTWPPIVLAAVAMLLTAGISTVDVIEDFERSAWLACLLSCLALTAGACWYLWLRVNDVAVLRRMGLHDETIASDLLRR